MGESCSVRQGLRILEWEASSLFLSPFGGSKMAKETERGMRGVRGRLRLEAEGGRRRNRRRSLRGKGQRVRGRERGAQKLSRRTKEEERERIPPSFHSSSPRPHPSFMSHPMFLVLLAPFGVGERGGMWGRVHRRRP